jgi:signal transduction histidine kinase
VKRISQTRVEWALLAAIAIVCAVLSFFQYRWTGELSRAEPALLRAGLNDQLHRLSQAFNNEIRDNCIMLLPDSRSSDTKLVDAFQTRYDRWISSHDKDLFLRIGMAAKEKDGVTLYGIDKAGRVAAMDWPADWEELHGSMIARLNGPARPPSARPDSNLLQMPIFAQSGPELGWLIFEINETYVRDKVLPPLIAEYLSPVESDYDVSVSRSGPGAQVIFSTRGDHSGVVDAADATAGLFASQVAGSASARGRGPFRDEGGFSRWTIAVRHRGGSLDAAVAGARGKNLIVSLILVGLLGGIAWALVQYTGRSRRLADMQFRFAAGVSHDLRTPLTAIRGAAFNLIEGVVKEPAAIARYLRLILRNAEELTAIIENVLAFSAAQHASRNGPAEAIAVTDVLEHAVASMTHEIEQAGCRMELDIANNLPAVAGDAVAIELVFRNLIGNALRHGLGGKWIGISAAPFGDGVEIRVRDHGPGIPEREQGRIFEPFYRGEQTRAQRVPGTGLGLSLVKNTIERYKGTVTVINSSGGGAEFKVRLPALQNA